MHCSIRLVLVASLAVACAHPGSGPTSTGGAPSPATARDLASRLSEARGADGRFISWREHRVDDEGASGVRLRGSDGLVMADLDADGHLDVVSVHESDDQYDGRPEGHIRIAFGSADPDVWHSVTLAEGPEAGGAEDAAVVDLDGDGDLDVLAACELAHLIYFENPGPEARQPSRWRRLIPSLTLGRGSYIRVFAGDLDGDGRPEVIATNKGVQDHDDSEVAPSDISFFALAGPPLADGSWREHRLSTIAWPINSQPVDLDGDGDLDIVGGSVAEQRAFWFENRSRPGAFAFVEHRIDIAPGPRMAPGSAPATAAFNVGFADLDGDGRLDVVTFDTPPLLGHHLLWLAQPLAVSGAWIAHPVGAYGPDTFVGVELADIDGDGDVDVMTGGYSRGSRLADGEAAPDIPLGRLAWFENPGRPDRSWTRHDISRRERGMFDKLVARDLDGDGDVDFMGTRGNSGPYDGVFWLEQVRSEEPLPAFRPARGSESPEVPLPAHPDG